MRKNKKLSIYSPGLISALFIPIILWHFSNQYSKTLIQGVTTICWYDPELPKKYPDFFPAPIPPIRHYLSIDITGDAESDKVKLDFSKVRLREILNQNDSIAGIQFHFAEAAEYWSFVRAIDICQTEGVKNFVPIENDLWVYHVPVDTTYKIESFVCGTADYLMEPTQIDRIRQHLQIAWVTSWPIIIGAASFILWAIYKLKKLDGS